MLRRRAPRIAREASDSVGRNVEHREDDAKAGIFNEDLVFRIISVSDG